jgi:hypothetical protein
MDQAVKRRTLGREGETTLFNNSVMDWLVMGATSPHD